MKLQVKVFHHVTQLVIVGVFPQLRGSAKARSEEEGWQPDTPPHPARPLRAAPRPGMAPVSPEVHLRSLQEKRARPSYRVVSRLLSGSVTHTWTPSGQKPVAHWGRGEGLLWRCSPPSGLGGG